MSVPDRYEIQAQYTPAILCSVPFVIFGVYYLATLDLTIWPKVFAVGFGGVTLSAGLYQLATNSCQILGKKLESVMFRDGLAYPTTEFLLDSNTTFSDEHKRQIIRKIKTDFKIDISNNTADTDANRRRVNEAVGQVRRSLWKVNPMVLQRNIQFGFAKNFAGGSIMATVASLALIIVSLAANNHKALAVSLILFCIYFACALIFVVATKFRARYYALTLFDEFLASK